MPKGRLVTIDWDCVHAVALRWPGCSAPNLCLCEKCHPADTHSVPLPCPKCIGEKGLGGDTFMSSLKELGVKRGCCTSVESKLGVEGPDYRATVEALRKVDTTPADPEKLVKVSRGVTEPWRCASCKSFMHNVEYRDDKCYPAPGAPEPNTWMDNDLCSACYAMSLIASESRYWIKVQNEQVRSQRSLGKDMNHGKE